MHTHTQTSHTTKRQNQVIDSPEGLYEQEIDRYSQKHGDSKSNICSLELLCARLRDTGCEVTERYVWHILSLKHIKAGNLVRKI